ncbi:MAG: gliding motility protein GldN [Bacteroidetes bacterium]|nr:gliding motility protein GldN [Bacteroidota bacterium]
MKKLAFFAALLVVAQTIFAQIPLNDITNRTVVADKPVLPYEAISERDIFWQKTTWRVLDVREKINLPFIYPGAPLFNILTNAARSGELTLYSSQKDDFSVPLSTEEMNAILFRKDTVIVALDETNIEVKEIMTEVNYEDVKRFRIKELWYFDSKTSQLKVRILGLAPLQEMYTESGDFIGEKALFWVHMPTARAVLSRELVFSEGNEASRMTWEDLFEMRKFSSYIMKEGNVRNNRLQDTYSGVDMLLAADKINQEIFNYESDLWSY